MNINKIVVILSLAVAISLTALTVHRYAGEFFESEGANSGSTVEDIIASEEGDDREEFFLK